LLSIRLLALGVVDVESLGVVLHVAADRVDVEVVAVALRKLHLV
jgi:hypothetical protein